MNQEQKTTSFLTKITAQIRSQINRHTIKSSLKLTVGAFISAIFFLSLLTVITANNKYQYFLNSAGLNHQEFINLIKTARQLKIRDQLHNPNAVTFLILGTDEVDSKPNSPQLTDSMILAQLNLNTAEVNILSLPRDLWSVAYQTKINALYEYGKEYYPGQPTQFPQKVIEEMIDLPIDYTLVISLAELGEIIDVVGGLTIEVENGFVDESFPQNINPNTTQNSQELYKTIEFKPGRQHMDGQTVLQYIRSRHSEDLGEGTDLARTYRQQQVLTTLLRTICRPVKHWAQPQKSGALFKFYQANYERYLPLTELIAIAMSLTDQLTQIEIHSHSLPTYPENENGVIEHPQPSYYYQNQWVYVIRNEEEFKNFVQQYLI